MEKKVENLIKKLQKENKQLQKELDDGLTKFKSSRARQGIKMNQDFIKELEKL